VPGVVKINTLKVKNGNKITDLGVIPPVSGVTPPDVNGKYWLSNPFQITGFGDLYYLPTDGYIYLDEVHTVIKVVTEKVMYYGCKRDNNCQ